MHWLLFTFALAAPGGWTVPGDIGLPATPSPTQPEGSLGVQLFSVDAAIDSAERLVVAGLECGTQDIIACEPLLDVRRWDGERWTTLVREPVKRGRVRVSTQADDTPVVAIQTDDSVALFRVESTLEPLRTVEVESGSFLMALATVPDLGVALWRRDTGILWRWQKTSFKPEATLTAPGWVRRSLSNAGQVTLTLYRPLVTPEQGEEGAVPPKDVEQRKMWRQRYWGWEARVRRTWPAMANRPQGPAYLRPTTSGPRWGQLAKSERQLAPLPVEGGDGTLLVVADPVHAGVHDGTEVGWLSFPNRPGVSPYAVHADRRGVFVVDQPEGPVILALGAARSRIVAFRNGGWRALGRADEATAVAGLGQDSAEAPTWVAKSPPTLRWIEDNHDVGFLVREARLVEGVWRDGPIGRPPPPTGTCSDRPDGDDVFPDKPAQITHYSPLDRPIGRMEVAPLCEGVEYWLGGGGVRNTYWEVDSQDVPEEAPPLVERDGDCWFSVGDTSDEAKAALANRSRTGTATMHRDGQRVSVAWVEAESSQLVLVHFDGTSWTRSSMKADLPYKPHMATLTMDAAEGRVALAWQNRGIMHAVSWEAGEWRPFGDSTRVLDPHVDYSTPDITVLEDSVCIAFVGR